MNTYDHHGFIQRGTLTPDHNAPTIESEGWDNTPKQKLSVGAMAKGASPCDTCPHSYRCGNEGLACAAFYSWINHYEGWAKAYRKLGQVGGDWRDLLAHRVPSALWMRRTCLPHNSEWFVDYEEVA